MLGQRAIAVELLCRVSNITSTAHKRTLAHTAVVSTVTGCPPRLSVRAPINVGQTFFDGYTLENAHFIAHLDDVIHTCNKNAG